MPSDAPRLATRLGAGRLVVATAVLAAPQRSARWLGADAGTARRAAWLTRMMAVRDGALGAGTLWARRHGQDARPWLVAAAVSDAVDAVVIAAAVRHRQLRGPVPALVVLGAGAAAGAGAIVAGGLSHVQG